MTVYFIIALIAASASFVAAWHWRGLRDKQIANEREVAETKNRFANIMAGRECECCGHMGGCRCSYP